MASRAGQTWVVAHPGPHRSGIVASFAGDSTNKLSQNSGDLVVSQTSTTTSLTWSANPSVFGQSVTFTAELTASLKSSVTIQGLQVCSAARDGPTRSGIEDEGERGGPEPLFRPRSRRDQTASGRGINRPRSPCSERATTRRFQVAWASDAPRSHGTCDVVNAV